MERENRTQRVFGDNPVTRPVGREMNTYEKLAALNGIKRHGNGSRIVTTPESIVRDHRRVVRLRTRGEQKRILTRPPDPVPWHQRVDWKFLTYTITIGCIAACIIYMGRGVITSFLKILTWQ